MIPRQRSTSPSVGGEWGISRSLRGSYGTAGGKDGCLEVTSEQRDEIEREREAVKR